MLDAANDDFSFDLDEDEGARREDLTDVFSVPGLPVLPALKPRWGSEQSRVLRPLCHSQPEPGIVDALRAACDTYEPPPVSEVRPVRRSRRSRRSRAHG